MICQRCEGVTGFNTVAFIGGGARDMQANFFVAESAVKVEVTEDLLCIVCDDEGKDKVFSEVTNSFKGETFSTVLFRHLGL